MRLKTPLSAFRSLHSNPAFSFVLLFGIVSLFSDMTHEGARSITGPFLGTLGASAAMIGFIAGFGEFMGYVIRLFSGYVSDKTKSYWHITALGYALNLLVVPLLAFAGNWKTAGLLVILERVGRGLRNPARDAMLSHATAEMGRGFGFGLHEALDQIGATIGPLFIAGILAFGGSFRKGFAFLLIPAIAALSLVAFTWIRYPKPETFEARTEDVSTVVGFPRVFWLYVLASSLLAAGFIDYPLLAFHIQKNTQLPVYWSSLLYTGAMGVDALAALVFGNLYDKKGIPILILSTLFSFLFAPMVFMGGVHLAVLGVLLWGIGMGAQESIMRAAVGELAPRGQRGTAYGIFNLCYGLCWFAGTAVFGFIYDRSISGAVLFSVVLQAAAIPIFLKCRIKRKTV